MTTLAEVEEFAASRFSKSQETLDHYRKHFSSHPLIINGLIGAPAVRLWVTNGNETTERLFNEDKNEQPVTERG